MTLPISLAFPQSEPPPPPLPLPQLDPSKTYFRGLHAETEGGRKPAAVGMPAVIPAENSSPVAMTEAIQWMSFDLMKVFCSAVDDDRWRILHGHSVAMTNKGAGFGYPGSILRDYVNRTDLTAAQLPKYDKVRTFQGSLISGYLMNGFILCTPGVDGIDARNFHYKNNVPAERINKEWVKADTPESKLMLQKIINNHWYSVAIGTGDPPYHFRSQWGPTCWIVYPFILDRVTSFDVKYFSEWTKNTLPEPLKTYVPFEYMEPR